jgi:YydF family exported signaling peptide
MIRVYRGLCDTVCRLNNLHMGKEEYVMLKRFCETDEKKAAEMKKQLDAVKLENVRSLWYFVTSSSGKVIAGSKG